MVQKVTVYSTPFCAPCDQLKRYLRESGVEFTVRDLLMDEDAADHLEALGIRGSPALEVDGNVYTGAQLAAESLSQILDPKGPEW